MVWGLQLKVRKLEHFWWHENCGGTFGIAWYFAVRPNAFSLSHKLLERYSL